MGRSHRCAAQHHSTPHDAQGGVPGHVEHHPRWRTLLRLRPQPCCRRCHLHRARHHRAAGRGLPVGAHRSASLRTAECRRGRVPSCPGCRVGGWRAGMRCSGARPPRARRRSDGPGAGWVPRLRVVHAQGPGAGGRVPSPAAPSLARHVGRIGSGTAVHAGQSCW